MHILFCGVGCHSYNVMVIDLEPEDKPRLDSDEMERTILLNYAEETSYSFAAHLG